MGIRQRRVHVDSKFAETWEK